MKCPLRRRIEEAIASAPGNPEAAALQVCAVLEDELDLEGNGWLEGDDEATQAIADFYDKRLEDMKSGKFEEPGDSEFIFARSEDYIG